MDYFTVPDQQEPYYSIHRVDPGISQTWDWDAWDWKDDNGASLKLQASKNLGGAGSGNTGHAGRPGQVGGSSSEEGGHLKAYMHQVAKAFPQQKTPEAVVLEHGQAYKPQELPKGYKRGKSRLCFQNAFHLAEASGGKLTYVEGFATPPFMPLPIHHAWAVDSGGNVIDNTWKTAGSEYYGIPFENNFIYKVQLDTGTYGVIDPSSKTFRDQYMKKKSGLALDIASLIDLEQAHRILELSLPEYSALRGDYWRVLYDNIEAYLSGTESISVFKNTVLREMTDSYEQAAQFGFADGGGTVMDEITREILTIDQQLETSYIHDLFSKLRQLRTGGDFTDFQEAIARADGYAKSLDRVYNEFKVRASGSMMLTFAGTDGVKSCVDCQHYKGRRHRASWWVSHNAIPPNRDFECHGYQCFHVMVDDNGSLWTM